MQIDGTHGGVELGAVLERTISLCREHGGDMHRLRHFALFGREGLLHAAGGVAPAQGDIGLKLVRRDGRVDTADGQQREDRGCDRTEFGEG